MASPAKRPMDFNFMDLDPFKHLAKLPVATLPSQIIS